MVPGDVASPMWGASWCVGRWLRAHGAECCVLLPLLSCEVWAGHSFSMSEISRVETGALWYLSQRVVLRFK